MIGSGNSVLTTQVVGAAFAILTQDASNEGLEIWPSIDNPGVHAILAFDLTCLLSIKTTAMQIPVIDIFAGPGGLGEGFSGFIAADGARPFRISVSAEKDPLAHATLLLRAFFRQFPAGKAPPSYYAYVAGDAKTPYTAETKPQWDAACEEALLLTLGEKDHDDRLKSHIATVKKAGKPWVLIGGPPCQAYSLVGRSRNKGKEGYRFEEDERSKLYEHYLGLIRDFGPAVFVMENVKGLLSAKVDGQLLFPEIVKQLEQPLGAGGPRYRLVPLIEPLGDLTASRLDPRSFVVHAEKFGVPQRRHRVILVGVSEVIGVDRTTFLRTRNGYTTVSELIDGLPEIRSPITDTFEGSWQKSIGKLFREASNAARACSGEIAEILMDLALEAPKRKDPGTGEAAVRRMNGCDLVPDHLRSWLLDPDLPYLLNHQYRKGGHQGSDLRRYAYASAFAMTNGKSPCGADDFPVDLHPDHANWRSGNFKDRFKVQCASKPSLTITSHLSKDGHYFIHPDPRQIRSLSVREAARLQTFPDNYFFEGTPNQQYHQIGNAVPPWLARQIAEVVFAYLSSASQHRLDAPEY